MEAVASALSSAALKNEREGLEILMQAIIQLPHYLEHVKVGRRDLPVVLLPILNELRSARGGSRFCRKPLCLRPTIRHNAPPLSPQQAQAVGSADFAQWARKVRQMLQTATLQLLQGKQPDVCQAILNKAFARLAQNPSAIRRRGLSGCRRWRSANGCKTTAPALQRQAIAAAAGPPAESHH